jgi:flavin-dependent dehydrogenase
MSTSPQRIAVIGAGPAGATVASLLAKAGRDVVMLDNGKRPELVVGESLVPLLVNVFRRLGIEDKVAALGVHKPGVTWIIDEKDALELSFEAMRGVLPTYAYNVPRREFDDLIHDTALASGARYVPCEVKLETTTTASGEVIPMLGAETLALIPEWTGQQPDLLIDASGRRRMFAKLLAIDAAIGARKDISHFAHFEGCEMPKPAGQTVITKLMHGWSWRIPLPGRLSVGVVMNKEDARKYGNTPEEQLDGVIDQNPVLAGACKDRRRVSPLATYVNYQLISARGHGSNWTCVGDAFGFVDPMLSPGLCMAMTSAEQLADTILKGGNLDAGFKAYLAWFRKMLGAWQDLVDFFYDGRIFAIFKTGMGMEMKHPGAFSRFMRRHIEKNLAGMAGGEYTARPYSRNLLKFLGNHGIRGYEPKDYAIV